ncbi:pyridoxamine 5'-phosphate oxidase family protein [uncultured Clostridium sp.]|uniref:pyridoxamine 5'-phosphate oxidase family protein n=1 Tax=uncultured Clostridium sp. TaxID=59620 RepID=UPI0025F52264|nr:pyridoxamine 5'-phosphate oxidase family protein [uncultured Clostridium sp.]
MNKDEIFQAISKNPVFFLGTIDGDQPRVRGMLLYKANENGILFHTASSKDLYKQVLKNPNAELCFNCNGTQIRITGKLEIIDDNNLKDEICNDPSRKFLEQWKNDGSFKNFYDEFIVFSLKHGSIVTWTMEDNFAAKSPILF